MEAEGSEDRGQDPLGTTTEDRAYPWNPSSVLWGFFSPHFFHFYPFSIPFLSYPRHEIYLGAITIYTALAEQHTSEKNIYKFPS